MRLKNEARTFLFNTSSLHVETPETPPVVFFCIGVLRSTAGCVAAVVLYPPNNIIEERKWMGTVAQNVALVSNSEVVKEIEHQFLEMINAVQSIAKPNLFLIFGSSAHGPDY